MWFGLVWCVCVGSIGETGRLVKQRGRHFGDIWREHGREPKVRSPFAREHEKAQTRLLL